jgi:hypothetical protein
MPKKVRCPNKLCRLYHVDVSIPLPDDDKPNPKALSGADEMVDDHGLDHQVLRTPSTRPSMSMHMSVACGVCGTMIE